MNTEALIKKIKSYPLAVAGAVLLIIIGGFGFLRADVLPELRLRRDDLQFELTGYESNIRNGGSLQEDLDKARGIVEQVERRLIDPEETIANLQYFLAFETISGADLSDPRQTGVTGGNYEVEAAKGKKSKKKAKATPFSEVGYSLDASGSYDQLLSLIHALQSSRFFLRVDTVNLSPSQSLEGSELAVGLTLSILGRP
ncbi:MAG: hypothetical protein ACFB20_12370 [Opitutales bacterium]